MVETRRSSTSSATKRALSLSSPSHPRSAKRSKPSSPPAQAEIPGEGRPDPEDLQRPPSPDPCAAADPPEKAASAEPVQEKLNDDVFPPMKRAMKAKLKAPWGKLLSQYTENPHLPISGPHFTVGQSQSCNLWLKDSSVSTVLCKLRQTERDGALVALLEISGSKGVVQVNGKTIDRKSTVTLTGGDEVVFSSSGNHAYIFQQLSYGKSNTPLLPSCSISEAPDTSIKGVQFDNRSIEPSLIGGVATILADLRKDRQFPRLPTNESSLSDADLSGRICKMFEDQGELLRDIDPSETSPSTRCQAFKDGLKQGILNPGDIEVSFDNFPYYLWYGTSTRGEGKGVEKSVK